MFDRLRRKLALWALDPNALTEEERRVLEQAHALEWPRSFVSLSIVHQIERMLAYRGVRFGGAPDWIGRSRTPGATTLRFGRFVGDEYSLPPWGREVEIRVRTDEADVVFAVRQSIRSARIETRTAPASATAPVAVDDEFSFWRTRADDVEEFREVLATGLDALASGRFSRDIVLLLPGMDDAAEIRIRATSDREDFSFVVPRDSTYGRLCSCTNGVRVNRVDIWGPATGTFRCFQVDGKRCIKMGADARGVLALYVEGPDAWERVFRLTGPTDRVERVRKTLFELCRKALRR